MFQRPIEIQISFDENSIVVQSESLTETFSNLIAIDEELGKMVAAGKTADEISVLNPPAWNKNKHKIVFEPIYDLNNFNTENMYWALTAWAFEFEYKLRGFRRNSSAICYAQIPGYETLPRQVREDFEYGVQSHMKFKGFRINGRETEFTRRKLNLASGSLAWGRWIGLALLVFLMARNVDNWPAKFKSWPGSLCFLPPLLVMMSIVAVIWIVDILWLIGMQRFLPAKFVRDIFQQLDSLGWSVSAFLPDLILKKEN